MNFLNIFKHLLPTGRAFRLTIEKNFRRFFQALATTPEEFRSFIDDIFSDIDPQKTTTLDLWENQFGLIDSVLSDQQRRDRLDAEWKATGGQSNAYIQSVLRSNGFDVTIHDWWETRPAIGDNTCTTPRNPTLVLQSDNTDIQYRWTLGDPEATLGNTPVTLGATVNPIGYPLVNKITETVITFSNTLGNPAITCGNPVATLGGGVSSFQDVQKTYTVPTDPAK